MTISSQPSPCTRCGGKGFYAYDHNHGKPCEACCEHTAGWFPLTEYHAHGVGYEACQAGCGAVRQIGATELTDTGAMTVWTGR